MARVYGYAKQYFYKTIDLQPAEFLKMKRDNPEEIASFQIIPPNLGKTNGFGKVRVTLANPKYEVNL